MAVRRPSLLYTLRAMKRTLTLVSFALSTIIQAQLATWTNYAPQLEVRDIVSNTEDIWLATRGGVVHIDVATHQRTFYNRSNSGLPANLVNTVALAANGDLWVGTLAGLARFNGASWTAYRPDNSPLPEAEVNEVATGPNGEVWMHCGNGGMITRLQSGTWNNVDAGISGAKSLAVASNGHLFVGTQSNGLLRYDGSSWTTWNTGNSDIPQNMLPRMAVGASDLLFLRCGVELVTFDGTTFTAYPIPASGSYSSNVDHLHVAADGICYVTTSAYYNTQPPNPTEVLFPRCLRLVNGTWGNLHHFGYPSAPQGPMGPITVDGSGTLWTGGSRFYSRTGSTWAVEEYTSSAPGQSTINSIHAANDGKVWATGSYGSTNNRYVFDGTSWGEFNSGQLLNPNDVITDGDGDPILATANGVYWADGFAWNIFNTSNSPLPTNYIDRLFMDNAGALWVIPNDGGILRYDGAWTSYTTASAPLSSNDVCSIAQHTDGTYWIGTGNGAAGGGGVSRFDGTNWTTWTPANANLPFNIFVRDISIASDGTPWLLLDRTSDLDNVARFDGTDFVLHDAFNSELPQYLTCLLVGPGDVPLVGTPYEGLMYLQPGTGLWSSFDITNSGIASNSVQDLTRAPNNDLWIAAGSAGVNRLSVDFFSSLLDVPVRAADGFVLLPSIADAGTELSIGLSSVERMSVVVIDATGRTSELIGPVTLSSGSHRLAIATSNLASGAYTVVVRGKTIRTARLLVQH